MMYYCEKCKEYYGKDYVAKGWTKDAAHYKNPSCPDCGSEELREIDESDLCHVCDGVADSDNHDWAKCAKILLDSDRYHGLRGEIWGLKYMYGEGMGKAMEYMELHNMTMEAYIIEDPQEFVEYVGGCIQEKIKEDIRLYERVGAAHKARELKALLKA